MLKITEISRVMGHIYRNWDDKTFRKYADSFSLPVNKPLKEFSRGMKMKVSIAAALSHKARLLILDEPTSGLDPIVRDEILDIFLEFIQDERNAVFVSTHILSDIEKAADYITFIHKGKIIFSQPKDEILENYGILKCGLSEFDAIDKSAVKGVRKNEFGVEALVLRDRIGGAKTIDHATLEDIMLFTAREDQP
jgi:ABC-2 type transport system ATP-binding protein